MSQQALAPSSSQSSLFGSTQSAGEACTRDTPLIQWPAGFLASASDVVHTGPQSTAVECGQPRNLVWDLWDAPPNVRSDTVHLATERKLVCHTTAHAIAPE